MASSAGSPSRWRAARPTTALRRGEPCSHGGLFQLGPGARRDERVEGGQEPATKASSALAKASGWSNITKCSEASTRFIVCVGTGLKAAA